MAGHHHAPTLDLSKRYELTDKTRKNLILMIVIGVVMVAVGCFLLANHWGIGMHEAHGSGGHEAASAAGAGHPAGLEHGGGTPAHEAHAAQHEDHESHGSAGWLKRLLGNLWLNSVFFTGLSVVGIFWVAVNYAAEAGWSAGFKRIPEAMGAFLPFALGTMLITFLVGNHDLFHWTHADLYDPKSPNYDAILDGKKGYLNVPFFLARMVIFGGLWWFFGMRLRRNSLREDQEGGTKNHQKNYGLAAAFLVIFGVSSSMVAWDWVMSIEPHWFSTLFGWYTFASWWVSGIAVMAFITTTLKDRGLLPHVNESHIHDLGKFMFAFSIFWTYLWTAQYLLIWYANMPEEAIYFIERLYGFNHIYTPNFFLNLILNFLLPFLILMPRDAKRTNLIVKVVAGCILVGHWNDFYQMIFPGAVGYAGGIGLVEFGMLAIFIGAYVLVVSRALASAPLVPKNDPMLQESMHFDI